MEEILDKLIETQNISKTAKFFNKDKSNLHKKIKKAIKLGILIKRGKRYLLGDLNKLLIELHGVQVRIPIKSLSYAVTTLLETNKIECEGFKRNIDIKPEQTTISFKEIPEFLIRLTSQSIIFIQKDEYPIRLNRDIKNITRLREIIEKQVRSKIPFLENRLMIDLDDITELHLTCDTGHYAFISDMLAKTFVANNQKLKVYINGELRTLIDISDGKTKPHLEQVHPRHNFHDAERWENFTAKLDTGEFDIDKIHQSIDGLRRISEIQTKEYAENIRLHLETLKEIKEAIKELKDKL